MAELDAMKALRPTGGLMLRRDGSGLPWGGKGEMLTQVERISKKIIIAAGLRSELTFTSFGRHGGTTEASTSGLTETQLMKKVISNRPKRWRALPAPRRRGQTGRADKAHQAASESDQKVNVCRNETAQLVE